MNTTRHEAPGLWFVLALPALVYLSVACLFAGAGAVPPPTRSLGTAACTMVVAHLMWPMLWRDARPRLRGLGLWASATAAIAALVMGAQTPVGTWSSVALPLAAGVLVVCVLTGTLTLFLHRLTRLSAPVTHRVVLIALTLTVTAPLWLGPLAAALASRAFTDLVIALSPVGYLASLIDHDALRGAWFYSNTPWGGLRYDYPDPVLQTVLYGALTLTMAGIATIAGKREKKEKGTLPFSPFPSSPFPFPGTGDPCASTNPTYKEIKS